MTKYKDMFTIVLMRAEGGTVENEMSKNRSYGMPMES